MPAGTGAQASQGETLKVKVLWVEVDGTGVPRCHSPERGATWYQHTVGAYSMSKGSRCICCQFSTSVILSNDL